MKYSLLARAMGLAGLLIATGAMAEEAKPLETISLRYGFVATGADAIWTYGIEKGFFKEQGIGVDLREGKGSAVTAQTVAAGTDDFGVDIDGGTFLNLASKGLPAIAVLANAAKSPLTILSPADKALKTPQDLIGKTIAITAGDGPSALLPVLLRSNNVSEDKVALISMQPGPKLTSLLTGRVDAVATNIVVKATLAGQGMDAYPLLYADFGVVTPGMYLVTTKATIASKPDMVRRFVAAAQKSMQATSENPEAAAESFSRVYPNYNKQTAQGEIKLLIALFHSAATQGKPLGTVSLEDAVAGAKVLAASGLMAPDVDVSKFVTDRFISGN